MIEVQVLRDRLSYDPLTGTFRWKVRPSNNMQIGDVAGCRSSQGYVIRIFAANHYARRVAWLYVHGEIPEGHEVYNLNRDRNDVRLENLAVRLAQQRAIARPMLKPTQTAHKNISRSDQGFRVQIYRNGAVIHRSRHTDLEAAVAARDAALSTHTKTTVDTLS